MPDIDQKSAVMFSNQLRSARLAALADAEAFDGIIHVVERLGSYISKEWLDAHPKTPGSLENYKTNLKKLAGKSMLVMERRDEFKNLLTPFDALYRLVKTARNDALHQGAFARHLTKHAIELSIILEDALSTEMHLVMDFMVRSPVYAELWHPVGFVRQQMLANSYSYLPVLDDEGCWHLVSDAEIAFFLRFKAEGQDLRAAVRMSLRDARCSASKLILTPPRFIPAEAPLAEALRLFRKEKEPLLLVKGLGGEGLLGILTAFDVL